MYQDLTPLISIQILKCIQIYRHGNAKMHFLDQHKTCYLSANSCLIFAENVALNLSVPHNTKSNLFPFISDQRRRIRRPSIASSKAISSTRDQLISASVNRFRTRQRPNKKTSDNAIAAAKPSKKDKDGYKVRWKSYELCVAN